jgi:cholinesterase
VFGFMSLDDEALRVPGNAGLKDQLFALKWVKKNIINFGGDSNNITVFGRFFNFI